ncbi:class I adenylate-forming enzyme family protein [Microbacterium sp. No. 7]|uniref:class I adenylate-forming enzyme family protein n=1 Tax=Microbacterium sp. No. 7 TaxID=1714373 RepID=UPI0006D20948|nr:AMP-binding protein [Microbacterium sp. No. 7]
MATSGIQRTVSELLRRSYDVFADRPAYVARSGEDVSFAQLRTKAARLAGGIAGLGASPDDRVVLALRNSEEFFLLDHGLLWGGYVRVAVSFRLHANEIAGIAQNADARAIVVDPETYDAVVAAVGALRYDVHVVRSTGAPDELTVARLLEAEPAAPHAGAPSDLAWMPYTSGTTGSPKGVMHTHATITATLRNLMAELPSVSEHDTLLQVAPLSHLAGWIGLLYAVRGARQVFLGEFKADEALAAIGAYGVTATPVVPTIVTMLTDEAERGDYDTSTLRTVIYAGSPMAPDKVVRAIKAFGSVFVQCYGLTEAPVPLTALSQSDHMLLPDGSVPKTLASAGRVTPFIDLRIVDGDGDELPDGEPGEVQVRGDQVLAGYWRLPGETIIGDDGWLASGDIGVLENGYLYIVDRKRDLIVSGGFNVFPSEVEAVISTVPGVAEVAVVGIPDPKWGETVLAAVVAEPGAGLTTEAIARACREGIAGYKQPRRIEIVDELPKNSSGKLMRRDLRARYWDGADRAVGG